MKIFYQNKNEITVTTDSGMHRCSLDELEPFLEAKEARIKLVFANSATSITMRRLSNLVKTYSYTSLGAMPNPRVFVFILKEGATQ